MTVPIKITCEEYAKVLRRILKQDPTMTVEILSEKINKPVKWINRFLSDPVPTEEEMEKLNDQTRSHVVA